MKIRLSQDFKDFAKMMEEITGQKYEKELLNATYDVIKEEKGVVYFMFDGEEEHVDKDGYIVVDDDND